MGNLLQPNLKRRFTLDSRVLIGRSRKCDLRLPHASVSGEHALIWWDGSCWMIRDLGSRNGTTLSGEPVTAEQPRVLVAGDVLALGHYPVRWTIESIAAPAPRAVSIEGVELSATDGMLALPDPEAPEVLVYADPYQGWVMESAETTRPVADLELLSLGGTAWRLHLPDALKSTVDLSSVTAALEAVTLSFSVSADEEHIRLAITAGNQTHDLGTRVHHYALLTLARQRLADRDDPEQSDEAQGWVYQEDLARMLQLSRTHLNLQIFRARKQFAALNIDNARDIIERRGDSRQIRIGSARIVIRTL
jgi:hypothetical protein